MRITDLLSQNAVCLGASVSGREEALDRLIALQGKAGNLNDAARYRADLLAREKLGSTAIGNGIAVPHAKSGAVLRPGLAWGTAIPFPIAVEPSFSRARRSARYRAASFRFPAFP